MLQLRIFVKRLSGRANTHWSRYTSAGNVSRQIVRSPTTCLIQHVPFSMVNNTTVHFAWVVSEKNIVYIAARIFTSRWCIWCTARDASSCSLVNMFVLAEYRITDKNGTRVGYVYTPNQCDNSRFCASACDSHPLGKRNFVILMHWQKGTDYQPVLPLSASRLLDNYNILYFIMDFTWVIEITIF